MPEGLTGQSQQTNGPPSDPSGRRASHVSRACRNCRRRKVKCDKNRPCSACVTSKTSEECGDSDTPDKRKRCSNTTHSSDSASMHFVATRLAAAEAEIVALRNELRQSRATPAIPGRGATSIDGSPFTTQPHGDAVNAHTSPPTSSSYAPPQAHNLDATTATQYLQAASSSSPFAMVHPYHYNNAEASRSAQTPDAHHNMYQGSTTPHDFIYDNTVYRYTHQHPNHPFDPDPVAAQVLQDMQGPSSNSDGTAMETQGVPMVGVQQYHVDAIDLDFDDFWDETEGGQGGSM